MKILLLALALFAFGGPAQAQPQQTFQQFLDERCVPAVYEVPGTGVWQAL